MLISIHHKTHYRYATEAMYAVQSLRLTPPTFASQRVSNWSIAVSGSDPLLPFTDGYGNAGHLAAISASHAEVVIEATGVVETEDRSGLVQGLYEPVPSRVYLRATPLTAPDATIRALAADVAGAEPLDQLHRLSAAVRERIAYEKGASSATTKAAEALTAGRGVCQDYAHVFISAARVLGVPARYVTGYMVLSDTPDEIAHEAHHAWAEAQVKGLGWIAFDVANRICPTDRYVRLACGLDAGQAAPIRGTRRGGREETYTVEVSVVPSEAGGQSQSQSQSQDGMTQSQAQAQTNDTAETDPPPASRGKPGRARKKSG